MEQRSAVLAAMSCIVLPPKPALERSQSFSSIASEEVAIVPWAAERGGATELDDLSALEIEYGLAPPRMHVPTVHTDEIDLELLALVDEMNMSKQKPAAVKCALTPDDIRRLEAASSPLPAAPARLAKKCSSAPKKRSDPLQTPKKLVVAAKKMVPSPPKAAVPGKKTVDKAVKKSRGGEVSMSLKCFTSRAFHAAERAARLEGLPEETIFARRRLAYQNAKTEWKTLYG